MADFFNELVFRVSILSWLDWLDLALVTAVFYTLVNLVRRSRVAFLLRGVLLLGALLVGISLLLPLPTFDLIVRLTLIALLIALPVIFHQELRRLLEQLGRSIGLTRAARQTATETVLLPLVRAVENLSRAQIGALIVLEGDISLHEVIETGIPINGQVSSELLQAIFYPSNPLHDGAAIIRGNQVVAAGCVLPLTQKHLAASRRLGTRHRAAVGISEVSDALAIVVSEETGQISVAQHGQLERPLDPTALREKIVRFSHEPPRPATQPLSWSSLFRQTRERWRTEGNGRSLRHHISNGGLSLLFAALVWWFVLNTTAPIPRLRIEGVPLKVTGLPADMALLVPPPRTVDVIIQTTAETVPSLSTASLEATISLENLPPGEHAVPVTAVSRTNTPMRIIEIQPTTVNLQLAAIITRTFPIFVQLEDEDRLTPAYQIAGLPTTTPTLVTVRGAEPLVEAVDRVQATVSVANVSASLQEIRPLRALDQNGNEITGLEFQPERVQVNVTITRRQNARDVGVRLITSGEPAADYWLSGMNVTPATVTLNGPPALLNEIGSFVNTVPVNIDGAAGNITATVPLDLPVGVTAVNQQGQTIGTVTVHIQVSPRQGDLLIERPVELSQRGDETAVIIDPPTIELLLSGPLPILSEIEQNPNLVRVLIPPITLQPGQNLELTPDIITP
ncbi:MAG: TIGR00159 family protein, partial [Chloroflexi bacterium]